MTLTRLQSEFTYQSSSGNQTYYFTVVVDQQGLVSVRNIQGPYGLIVDSMTQLPGSVVDDIQTARQQVEDMLASTSAINGTITFTNESSKTINFPTPMSSTDYGVYFSSQSFVIFVPTSKTTTGFTVQASSVFTGDVRYDVFI